MLGLVFAIGKICWRNYGNMSSTCTFELADSNPKEHMTLQTPFAQVLLLSCVSRASVLRVDPNESEMDGN